MSNYAGVTLSSHSKRYLKEVGGAAFLDKLNEDLLIHVTDEVGVYRDLMVNGTTLANLNRGASRIAFRYKNLVFKFPKERSNDNVNEWLVYQEMRRIKMHKHFAASVALLDGYRYGLVLVAEFVPGRYGEWMDVQEFSRKLSRRGTTVKAADLHEENNLNGKILDYGHFYGGNDFDAAVGFGSSSASVKHFIDKLQMKNKFAV